MTRRLALALLAGTALVPAAAFAGELPTGGTVVAGQASIATPSTTAMQITQSSDRAVIDWTSFNIGANARVDVAQPSATAALLNRVTGSTTSTIAGQLNANGRVFLVNPNGILITSTGSVKAAGFIASTLDTSNVAFMGGSDELTVVAPSRGEVGIVKGGYAGLMQGRDRSKLLYAKIATVESDGTTRSAIDLEGNGFLQVAVPKGGITVAGRITANEVVLTTGTAQDAARSVVNLTGTIAANSVSGTGGTVTLTGTTVNLTGATIDVSGATGGGIVRIGGDRQGIGSLAHATDATVDAASAIKADATGSGNGGNVTLWSDGATAFAGSISAKGAGGIGGEAEVSGHDLAYTGTTDLTGTRFGTLLLDPYNVTISSAANATSAGFTATGNDSVINNVTLQNALATANVTVLTGSSGTQAGDITVAAPLTWSSNSQLTLTAAGSIAVNAGISVTGGGKVALNFSTANTITGGLSFAPGSAITFADGASQGNQSLTINNNAYTLLRSMTDVAAINNALTGNYALAHDLTSTATYADAVIGAGGGSFSGTLEGLGHTITNLTIASTGINVGLIGQLSGTVRDIGLLGGSVSGGNDVGALVGYSYGTVINAYATGTVTGSGSYVGGLVGNNDGYNGGGIISNSYATGAVSGSDSVGGLVGSSTGDGGSATVSDSYATGTVTGSGTDVGGLVGYLAGYGTASSITNAYATGNVTGSGDNVGGLVGYMDAGGGGASITNAHATGTVTGSGNSVGGLVGRVSANGYTGTISNTYATGTVSGQSNVGGLVGYNNASGGTAAVSDSFATGAISGSYNVGGLLGFNDGDSGAATVSNTYATGAVSGIAYVGGLVGYNSATGATATVSYSYATGAISGSDNVGGLVGGNAANGGTATVSNVYATGTVNSSDSSGGFAGGLVGTNDGFNGTASVTNAYATGAVIGYDFVGGLIGYNNANSGNASVTNAYATSFVQTLSNTPNVGGLVGLNDGTVNNGYYDTNTSARSRGIGSGTTTGATGLTTDQFQSGTAGVLGSAFAGGTGGLYPYLASFYPSGVQVIAGIGSGATVAAAQVGVYQGGVLLGGGIVSTGANGYYYTIVPTGTLTGASAIGLTVAPSGGGAVSGLGYTDAAALDTNGNLYGLSVSSGIQGITTAVQSWSALPSALSATFGSANYANLATTLATTSQSVTATRTAGFTVDSALSLGAGNLTLVTNGPLTLANTIAANSIKLASGGVFVNTAGANALTAATRWLVYSADPANNTLGGLTPGFIQYNATYGVTAPAQASGNGLLYTLAPVLTVGLTGAVSKSYDGTRTATLAAGNYTVSGAVGGDTVTLTTTTGANYSTANVGTGKTVGTTGLAIASASKGTAAVYGYRLASTTASGAIGAITPATLTYTATPATRLYGNANPALSGTVTGFVGSETRANATTGSLAFTSAAGTTSNVGSYGVNGSGLTANNGNYVFVQAAGNATALSVTARPITVTADALSRIYGNANPALTYTVGGNGLVNGDSLSGALATSATTTSNVGAYGITQGSVAASSNYALTYTGADLSVTARPITVTADALSRIYGNANPALTYTVGGNGLVNGDALSGVLVTSATNASNVGAYGITQGSVAASSNYALTYTGADLSVTARPITVTADALSRIYGNANPALTYTVGGNGLVNGDTLSGALATSATTTSNVGAYGITQGSVAASSNYALSYTGANLSVTARPITVTADALTRLYGNANPALTYTVGGNGLVGSDSLSGALATSATTTSNVGAYGITQGTLAASANYAVTYTGANLTVTARPIMVTADALSRLYGNANPALTYTVGGNGLVNGDTLSGALATTATTTSNVGAYGITQGTLAASSNYALTYAAANLTVTARPITVSADALSRLYGNANPALTYTVGGNGLVNGDTLSGAQATSATVTSNVGAYGITQGSLAASSNYVLTYTGTNLTVTARPITVTADALSRIYGNANPALTYTVGGNGLVGSDSLSGALATGATMTSNVGAYGITQGTLAASTNYSVTYTGANLTVTARPITVTADALSRIYGNANPALTYTIGGNGLVDGDTLSGALATSATVTSAAGNYEITQGSLAASNSYAVSYTGANLTVIAAPQTTTVPPVLPSELRAGTIVRDGNTDVLSLQFHSTVNLYVGDNGGFLSGSLDSLAVCVKYQGCGSAAAAEPKAP